MTKTEEEIASLEDRMEALESQLLAGGRIAVEDWELMKKYFVNQVSLRTMEDRKWEEENPITLEETKASWDKYMREHPEFLPLVPREPEA